MASGDAQADAERKEAYYLRFHLLVVKHGTDILRARFDHAIPPAELHKELQKCIQTIISAKNKNRISQAQYHQLYPTQGPPNSANFDVSLLYFLLRNICHLNGKSKWWNESNNNKIPDTEQSEEADIQRIRNMRNDIQHTSSASLEDNEFERYWDIMEKAMCRLASKCNVNDMNAKLIEVKSSKLDLVSDELRSLRVNSQYFLQDFQNKYQFVETSTYNRALDTLKNKNIVILTGYPGEGKTTMAARLALSLSQPRNCLKLSNPRDWRHIDLSLKLVDTIIIDDIFGAGSLDQRLVGEWRNYLPEIEKASKKKEQPIRVIITSRHYILKESLEEIGSLPLFKGENEAIVLLSSANLTEDEKSNILKLQSVRNEKEITEKLLRECVEASRGPTDENPDFLFGFPECASMFVRSEKIYRQGAKFFKKPSSHFKTYLEDLYRGKEKDKFLALVAVWAKENKQLPLEELRNRQTASEHIKSMAKVFGRDLDVQFLDMLKSCLDSHVGDYLVFDERKEEYAFSHNVIGDMVGLVIGKKKPKETVEICPRDFLMEYVSIDNSPNVEFKIVMKEIHFPCLADKCINMLLRKNCNSTSESQTYDEFHELRRAGKRSNVIKIDNTIDYGMIKHKAFSSQKFVQIFIDDILQQNYVAAVFHVPIMKMKGYFFDYGISMEKLVMCLMGYAWFSGAVTFAKEVITRDILGNENFDPSMSLLLATHSSQRESIDFLINHGARVTGDVIYIAMHHKQTDLLEMLLQRPGTDVNDRGNAVNGNYPLIVAARKGMVESVTCLLKNGADPGVKNTVNMTALHKAIIYKHKIIVTCLLEANAPLDIKGGKYKRTPLHLAADLDNVEIAEQLVNKGASLKVKDYRGQFPIFIAAIRNHLSIVRFLLKTDPSQDKWRISSYGSKSMIKGMSLFHVAVWRKNSDLMDALIEHQADPNVQDFFGQTPLFYAVMKKDVTSFEKLLAYAKTDMRKAQKQGYTPLHAAIHKGLTAIAVKLAGSSDVNARDRFGRTPLHVACETANFVMVFHLLTENSADPRALTKRGDTVFHILKRKRKTDKESCQQIEQYLIDSDPEIVHHLPNLNNKKGIAIHVKQRHQPHEHTYWQTLYKSQLETLQKRYACDVGKRRTIVKNDSDTSAEVEEEDVNQMRDNDEDDDMDIDDVSDIHAQHSYDFDEGDMHYDDDSDNSN